MPAARALAAVGPRNARRISLMGRDGGWQGIGRTDELLGVVGRYGDRAMDFIWCHKGALTVATLLATFVADPGPFLDGTRDLVGLGAQATVGQVAAWPSNLVAGAARGVSGALALAISTLLIGRWALRGWRKRCQSGGRPRE
jgi:hypothetical protein